MSHDDKELSVSQITFPSYVPGNKYSFFPLFIAGNLWFSGLIQSHRWIKHAENFLKIVCGGDNSLPNQNYVCSMRRYRKLAVIILCVNAIASAASGTFVDITWYFYIALAFAFVNLTCSVFLFYGIAIRLYLLMLPYIFCICINFLQCMFTLILTFRSQGMGKGKLQVYVFLGYLGFWLLIIPVQLYVTIRYVVRCLKKKTSHIKPAALQVVISEEFSVPPQPVRILLRGPFPTSASTQN